MGDRRSGCQLLDAIATFADCHRTYASMAATAEGRAEMEALAAEVDCLCME